jgi:hypothetical protein
VLGTTVATSAAGVVDSVHAALVVLVDGIVLYDRS